MKLTTKPREQASVTSPVVRVFLLFFPWVFRLSAKLRMGKRGIKWPPVLSQAASLQRVLNRLAASNKRVGKTLQLSLMLTKALARTTTGSTTNNPRTHALAHARTRARLFSSDTPAPGRPAGGTRRHHNPNPNNLTAKLTPQATFLLHLVQPCLDVAPWIYSLVFLARLPFPLSPLPSLTHAMASSADSSTSSTSSNDISTPRSISPLVAANPMSTVDIAIIEDAMKMANLDTLRGYATDHYGEVHQDAATHYVPQNEALGYQVLNEPTWNKGLSFSPEQRIAKNLTGLIPHVMEDRSKQCERALKMIRTRQTGIDKYLYLSNLKAENVDLFYRLLIDHAQELMPLVYTPTIGDVCLQYSTLYTRPEALYISIKQRKSMATILRNWHYPNPEICVVTDGSRILGLGDLGVNGVGIPIGKLALYTAAAGIHPEKTLPIVLDCGTANETNLKDPLYLGLRSKRPSFAEQQEFMDEFMQAAAEVYPDMVVQFEDFESEKAFKYLDKYRDQYKCFNDDIQGTGAVVLGGYIGAVNLSGVPLEEQRLVFMGAGSAGVGVAKQLVEYYTKRGLSEQAAKEKFWLVDTKGLVTKDRGDRLAEHKKYFARTDNEGHQFRTLEEVIEYVKPSALIGLTATHGVFTESVVRALQASVDAGGLGRRPILFPLSNPLSKAECTFEQAVTWTDGTVIFASGSPFSSFTVKNGDQESTYYPNQGNNVYVFPGIGLGAILAKATRVTDDMIYTSAAALSGTLNPDEIQKGLIYPRIERVREASLVVAREVMKAARRDGVSNLSEEQWLEWEEWGDPALDKFIKTKIYDPEI
ncbi:hypothetical protein N0V88_002392 [Collariella sp. IMI 366227]|nr:hypothetical protein N0V88_002392 [Collariella sp. IMI 366227]